MKVSVVVPVYNKAPYLQECLDSVFAQSFSAFELIAVDDGSTDGSLEILQRSTDPRIRVVRMERNSGPGLAAQRGHDLATGTYIIRVDADDVQHPERFARQVAHMDARPEVGVSGSAMRLLNARAIRRRPLNDAECRVQLLFGVPVFQPTMILRRSVLVEHGIRYDPNWPYYGEDWLLKLRLFPHTRFSNLPESLVEYREGGISSTRSTDDLHYLYRHVFQAFGLPEPSTEQLDLHCMAVKHFRRPPDGAQIRAFKGWLDQLRNWNRTSGHFEQPVLEQFLAAAWKDLFHYLTAFGPVPVWAYLRAGGKLDAARAYYLVRTLKWRSDPAAFSSARRG
jgi:GT2 family glycosyltransferase